MAVTTAVVYVAQKALADALTFESTRARRQLSRLHVAAWAAGPARAAGRRIRVVESNCHISSECVSVMIESVLRWQWRASYSTWKAADLYTRLNTRRLCKSLHLDGRYNNRYLSFISRYCMDHDQRVSLFSQSHRQDHSHHRNAFVPGKLTR